MPNPHKIREHKYLRIFGDMIHAPNLWHLNRKSVSGAFAVGLFSAFIPIPFQMILAAAMAILFHVNLPISVALVWITNPATMPAIFYFCYLVGTWVINAPANTNEFALTLNWVMAELEPFLLGCLICGTIASFSSYVTIRCLWKINVLKKYNTRKLYNAKSTKTEP